MSSSSVSPPSTPAEPRTPPLPSPSVRITLPTPPSFSRRQRSHSITQESPRRQTNEEVPLDSPDSDDSIPAVVHEKEWKKAHGRSVSFNLPAMTSPISPTDTGSRGSLDSPGLYRIPQRSPDYVPSPLVDSPAITDGEKKRRAPPRPLSLSPASQRILNPAVGVSPTTRLGPLTAPAQGASRWSSTAAARGLSIAPALAKQRHSASAASGGSIWSANLASLGAASGWISPALASARSTGTAARTRGLTVAVIKDGKEVIMETLPTPGLPSAGLKSPPVSIEEETEEMEVLRDEVVSPDLEGKVVSPALSSGKSEPKRPKEIILCRYYHTPGLTCTSRPCRFVHDLATIGVLNASITDYSMKSPTTANLPSALLSPQSRSRPLSSGSPDFTSGTFAAFQAEARKKSLSVKDVDEKGIVPGEKVMVAAENGEEVEGMVFLMSGGGKGPAGKGKAKFKTVPCKDYATDGCCPYGDYCSFIHEDKGGTPKSDDVISPLSATVDLKSPSITATTKSDRRKSLDPAITNAWRKIPPSVKQTSVSILPDALGKHTQGLSAFAPPFTDQPVIVDKKGELVPSTPGLPPKSTFTPTAKNSDLLPTQPLTPKEMNTDQTFPAPKTKKKSAWTKGPPANLKQVTINSTPVVHLTVPVSATSIFGTESDPATPWDPALRAERLANSPDQAGERNPEHPPTATYATIVPDSKYGYPSYPNPTSTSEGLTYPYPFNAPAYPWGMPMSPVHLNPSGEVSQVLPQIQGGLGVMWTPAGWAVQDAAMKMALFNAENTRGDGEYKPKSYWRTKRCKFFADGNCPHGESCTYIHELPSTATTDAVRTPSKLLNRKNHQTQPCKFFNSSTGCLNGPSCAFLHTLVVPSDVALVENPRPWRTRPCRHFQINRCHLGDACHFAHVYGDPSVEGGDGEGGQQLTEESLARALEGVIGARAKREREEDEDSEDDLEIVTQDTSTTISPPRSVLA